MVSRCARGVLVLQVYVSFAESKDHVDVGEVGFRED